MTISPPRSSFGGRCRRRTARRRSPAADRRPSRPRRRPSAAAAPSTASCPAWSPTPAASTTSRSTSSASRACEAAAEELGVEMIDVESNSAADFAPNIDEPRRPGLHAHRHRRLRTSPRPRSRRAEANPDIEFVSIDDAVDTDFDGTTDCRRTSSRSSSTPRRRRSSPATRRRRTRTTKRRRHVRRHALPDRHHLHGRLQAGRRVLERARRATTVEVLGWDGTGRRLHRWLRRRTTAASNAAQGLVDQGVDVLLPVGGPIYQSAASVDPRLRHVRSP